MYLLDTTAVSLFDPRRQREAASFISWVRSHDPLLFLSVFTLTEIESGILKLVRERKVERANQLVRFRDSLIADYADRLLPVDTEVALSVARIAHAMRPRVIELADLIIAATARVHGLVVVTRNVRHFVPTGVSVVDPLSDTLTLNPAGPNRPRTA
jgi:predicted nucleic acid-binding protein